MESLSDFINRDKQWLASEQIVTFAHPSSANADENQGKFDYSHHDMSRGQRSQRESIYTNIERNVKRSFCIR